MRLTLHCSFEPASFARALELWNGRVPLFDRVEASGPERLPFSLDAEVAPDELRVLVLDAQGLRTAIASGAPRALDPRANGHEPLVVLLPDQRGPADPALLLTARCELLDGAAIAAAAGVGELFDRKSLRIAGVPYREGVYLALATAIFRAAYARLVPEPKVIALDCDGTLWQGLCAEAGPWGISIGEDERALHAFLLEQKRAGRLLCLVSKNVPADVEAVFAARTELGLSLQDFADMRISWNPKQQSLRELSAELGLSLDSFVLLDDSVAECAEVSAACPEVSVLLRPASAPRSLLEAAWLLDLRKVSPGALGEERTRMYREEASRRIDLKSSPSFAEHVRGLAVHTSLRAATASESARVFELAQRTNQFNTAKGRPSAAEVAAQIDSGDVLVCHVSDRFGDYGLCGAAFVGLHQGALHVSRLLLSCRVLGRGVEEAVFDHLAAAARERGATALELSCATLPRNLPAQRFFASLAERLGPAMATRRELASSPGFLYRFPLESLQAAPRLFETAAAPPTEEPKAQPRTHAPNWTEVAELTRSPERLAAALGLAWEETGGDLQSGAAGVLQVIGEVMGRPVSATDNLYALGADSLRMVRILSRLHSRLGLELPVGEVLYRADVAHLLELAARAPQGAAEDTAFIGAQLSSLYEDDGPGP